ncbi:MAG: polysaccharide biosynthesis/export family protein [Candidatus Methylacidiphilales bacterium]
MTIPRNVLCRWTLLGLLLCPLILNSQEESSGGSSDLLPLNMEGLDDTYRFKVGDQVVYRVIEDRDEPVKRIVTDTGEVALPYVGRIRVQDFTAKEVALTIKTKLEASLYKKATVLVALDTQRKYRGKVYIFGAVSQPGSIQIPTDEILTVSRAILKVGGFAQSADRTNVRIERQTTQGKQTFNINLVDIIDGGNSEKDMMIEPNDFIVVANQSSRGRVFVTGEVMRPGPVPIPSENPLTVSEAIMSAGGFQQFADKGKVRIIRKIEENSEKTQELIVNVAAVLEKGQLEQDMELQPEDRVVVRARWVNF